MSDRGPTVAYVCDHDRMHHLLPSLASWSRFAPLPVAIIDIGLSEADRRLVRAVAQGPARFLEPVETPPVPYHVPSRHRAFAFAQKTLVGRLRVGDPVLFLDSDILVVHSSFLERLAAVRPGELLASPSVWDADFNWTYTAESLPGLQAAAGDPTLALDRPICNSGVWSMREDDARAVATRWHAGFRTALDLAGFRATLRSGTEIGDQEFLVPACKALGVEWTPLHGSFNMQVHEQRTPWREGPEGHPLGGAPAEPPEPVRAIHYGCEPGGTVALEDGMITSALIRDWIVGQFRECAQLAHERTRGVGEAPLEGDR